MSDTQQDQTTKPNGSVVPTIPATDADSNAQLADLARRLRELEAENLRLKAASASRINFKVGEKGGISIIGLGKFPTTLYVEQWERLITAIPALQQFINDHRAELKPQGSVRLGR